MTHRTGNKDIRGCEAENRVCIRKTKMQREIWKELLLESGRLKTKKHEGTVT
jgi:hypothetical protein